MGHCGTIMGQREAQVWEKEETSWDGVDAKRARGEELISLIFSRLSSELKKVFQVIGDHPRALLTKTRVQ